MKRCPPQLFRPTAKSCLSFVQAVAVAIGITTAIAPLVAQAQTSATYASPSRTFPPAAQYGTLVIGDNAQATVDGKLVRTAPGLRIFNTENGLVHAHLIKGQKIKVNYLIEPSTGFLQTAWVLAPHEIPRKSWFGLGPVKPQQEQAKPLPVPKPVDSATSSN